MDFKKLNLTNRKYNFHSHTQYCDGRDTMEAFAKVAVDEGFSHYGFSPHSPIPIASPANMAQEDVELYLRDAQRIQKRYAESPTHFYAAMEVDYLGPHWGPSISYFNSLPLDYRIGSVHFIPNQNGELLDVDGNFVSFGKKLTDHFRGDLHYVVNKFYDQSLEMVTRGGFDIIGHYDKIGNNASHFQPEIEQEDWYIDRVNQLTEAIIQSGVAVEINTKARANHGRFFPSEVHWHRLTDAGVTILVNSDAHYSDLINASRDEALDLLEQITLSPS